MKKYSYPDAEDEITMMFISKDSDNKYWEESEKNFFYR